MSDPFRKTQNVIQDERTDWNAVGRLDSIPFEQAQTIAWDNDLVTFFFYTNSEIVLPTLGTLSPRTALFFTGKPTYVAASSVDAYEKLAAPTETGTPEGSGFIYCRAVMRVPDYKPNQGTVFLWPGLQPNGLNYDPINNGVLQPVLTYGPSCAPNSDNLSDNQWWISNQYVNSFTGLPSFSGCYGGNRMALKAGDSVAVVIQYMEQQQSWLQTIEYNGSRVPNLDFLFSLVYNGKVQEQNRALFQHEFYDNSSLECAFSLRDIQLRTSKPNPQLGQDLKGLPHVTDVRVSADYTNCSIARIIIYSPIGANKALTTPQSQGLKMARSGGQQ